MLYCILSNGNRGKFRRRIKASLNTAITTNYTDKSTIPYLSKLVIIIKLLRTKCVADDNNENSINSEEEDNTNHKNIDNRAVFK